MPGPGLTFYINEEMLTKVEEWKEAIRKVFGEYGSFEYSFRPGAIGMEITVYSTMADKTLCISEVEKW